MQYFYSAINKGFYCKELESESVPEDAKEITQEFYNSLLEAQGTGLEIVPDASGLPTLTDKKSEASIRSVEMFWIESELSRAGEELNKVQDADPKAFGTVADWRAYRRDLRSYSTVSGFPNKDLRPVSPK